MTSTAPDPAAAAPDEPADCGEVCLVAPREGFALVPCGHARFCDSCATDIMRHLAVSMCFYTCVICVLFKVYFYVYILHLLHVLAFALTRAATGQRSDNRRHLKDILRHSAVSMCILCTF